MNRGTLVFLLLISTLIGVWSGYMWRELGILTAIPAWPAGAAAALICFVFCSRIILLGKRIWDRFISMAEKTSIDVLMGGIIGLLAGATIGFIIGYPFSVMEGLGRYFNVVLFSGCGFLGLTIGRKRARDFMQVFPNGAARTAFMPDKSEKVLDTSAIIDGRIYDVALSGFLEGKMVVPAFVIEELRHIADSSDYVRRSKGRRGLEILSRMQKHTDIRIRIHEGDFPEEREVDMKLLRLCREINASIITNDFNLNKVAELQGIKVLNVNELTNAVKVIVFPGETMRVSVIKEGKEEGQGVGYLEDGTMVVVENGETDIGHEVEVVVTSVFQTAAGRMIFTRKARENNRSPAVQNLSEVNMLG